MFNYVFQVYTSSIKKLEISLFKYYVVNAIQNNKQDKVHEFFEKFAPDLQHQVEWKDWFGECFNISADNFSHNLLVARGRLLYYKR